jgi:membrane protease YdiL (CAAX protease family)
MDTYLNLARLGKNDWWRYVLSVLLIFFLWQIIGFIPTGILFVWVLVTGKANTMMDAINLPGIDPLLKFIALMSASVFFLAGIILAVIFIHKRPFRTMITPARRLAWGRFWLGGGLWFGLAGMSSLLEALLFPGRYEWSFDLARLIPFALCALVFIPIQASTEELFFRAYLLQGLGLRIRRIWLLCLVSGLIFMAPHFLNPEAASNYWLMGLSYFSMGAFLAYITLWDGRLELAMGVHTANNLFTVLIANTKISSLPSPSIFTVNVLDPVFSVPVGLVAIAIFVWLIRGPLRPRGKDIASLPASTKAAAEEH